MAHPKLKYLFRKIDIDNEEGDGVLYQLDLTPGDIPDSPMLYLNPDRLHIFFVEKYIVLPETDDVELDIKYNIILELLQLYV